MPKKDFAGKNKTSQTYDADWVFHNGAWMTKKQRKKAIRDQKEQKAYMANLRAMEAARENPTTPSVPAPPGTAPILPGIPPPGSGDLTAPKPPGTGDLTAPKPPSLRQPQQEPVQPVTPPPWWINQAIKDPKDPNQQFANVANALLPTLSPEDQRTLANYLATNFKDVYGGYATTDFGTAPTEITSAIRKQYLSPQRAQTALSLLERMKQASGATDMGPGYDFLKNAINLITQFTNPQGMLGREHYDQFTNAVSSLIEQSGKDVEAYANLAQMFNLPRFSAGPLINNAPNARLF